MRGVRLSAWGLADGRADILSSGLEEAVAALESLLFAKYQMFRNVYWHHGVRGATAIYKRIVEEAQSHGISRRKTRGLLKQFEGKFWDASRGAANNAIIYKQIPVDDFGKASNGARLKGLRLPGNRA